MGTSRKGAGPVLAACAFVLLSSLPALALIEPSHQEPLHQKVVAPTGFGATVAPQELSGVREEVDPALLDALVSFHEEAGPNWKIYIDRRSGGIALAEGQGLAWIPGRGNDLHPAGTPTVADLEAKARDFLARYPALFAVAPSQLVLDERATVNSGESRQYWNVVFRQVINGVPVRDSRVVLRLSHGNLVQFGVDRTVPARSIPREAAAVLTKAEAKARLAAHVGGFGGTELFQEDGDLMWVLRGTGDEVGYSGPLGEGWDPLLVYRFSFKRGGEIGTWQTLIDARNGSVLKFADANDYAALVKASVYTLTNCTDPLNCVPGDASEVAVTMPAAGLNFAGGLCSGDGCYSNSAGAFDYPPGAVAASTSLDGKYFRIVDSCGAISAAGVAPGNIDLGTSPASTGGMNKDCQPATQQSPPGSGATSGGNGDTHAARNTFYHLNLINQKSRAYLPDNDWLKGTDGSFDPVLTNTNVASICNALWNGTGLVFMQSNPALSCNNTGEIPDVFLHEFGHGLDQNDATGDAPESATGEAMGDSFALLQGQHSCIGPGVFLSSGSAWGHLAGYGTGSALCSGIRDLDYTRYCYHGAAAGCTASIDPDAPNGSRSGPNPPPHPPDAGTPARWNHMIQGAPAGVADGQSNFYNCGGPESVTDCAGPLEHGCHCESLIASQSNWDLVKLLIASEFGGDIYAVPQGPREVSGWQYMDRLWYLTRDLAISAYSVTGPAPTGTTNGCAASNWFTTYRFIDDDNGNLADGTPHADLIFAAFNLHAIACGAANDPSNLATGCPAPLPAPVLSACGDDSPVQLEWNPSVGAQRYRVLRNTLGCGSGFTPLADVDGNQHYFQDPDVAPGIPYYYSVQPVGANGSCYGQASNCVVVTPSTCSASALPAPTGVNLSAPANNQVQVAWNAVVGAQSYKILRRTGDCSAQDPFVPIGVVQAPQTSFLDTIALQGQFTYAYQVVASESDCASCTSPPSACASIAVTGACDVSPEFGGVDSVSASPEARCQLEVSWTAAQPACGGSVLYTIYRSTDPGFLPTRENVLVSGLTGTSFIDRSVVNGNEYFYLVRAIDQFGNTDSNLRKVSGTPVGGLQPSAFEDDAGDTGTAKFTAPATPGNTWTIRSSGTGNATKQYATTAAGNYADNRCMALESPVIFLGANPALAFQSRYDIEPGWDGGIIQVATESGGYTNWAKLETINYPGVMAGPQGEPACGSVGFEDGEPVFTGTSVLGWSSFSGSLSAYANQTVRVRFLFGSDPTSNAEGWFVDEITVTGALAPGDCLSEVSSRGSAHPLRIGKRPDGDLDLIFEDLGPVATAYNVYEGEIGTWYSHLAEVCHETNTIVDTPQHGDRTLAGYDPGPVSVYILVNAVNSQAEGVLGFDSRMQARPFRTQPCGPMP